MMKNKLVLFLLFLFAPCLAWGQSHSSNLISRIDSLVRHYQKSLEVPGLAVGLILDGKIVYKQAIGEQNLETKAPLTERSLFHMASVSKPFVATALMQLLERGKIDLDEKLTTYLPYFKMADKRYTKISLRQMLQHSSGIPDVEDYGWKNPEKDPGAAERYIRTFKDSVLDFKPGKEFSYSNAAFDILADVIARASGMSFEEYMKKNILEPAGMQNSTFYKPEVPSELATAPHWLDEELKMKVGEYYPYNRRHAPSSTLHSNVEDMLRWAQFNLNRGSFEGKQIYQTYSYQALTQAQLPVGRKDSVCLSWFKTNVGDYTMYAHSGGDEGYRTYFGFVPEKKAAVVLMANHDYLYTGVAARALLGELFEIKDKLVLRTPIHLELRKHILGPNGIEKCKAIYREAKEKYPNQYYLSGGNLDNLGYMLLDRQKYQAARDIFLFNIELFPEEAGFYDSVGDAYRAEGKDEEALNWYRQALAKDKSLDFTKKKIKEMTRDQKP